MNKIARRDRGYTVVELLIGLGFVASLALSIAGVCVLVHFIAKFW